MKGIIICTSSNLYQVKVGKETYQCVPRGKFKKENIRPLVGDEVEMVILDESKKEGTLEQILPRKNELKRPKMANLTQIILVVSMKMPAPDLLLLDKQLAFASWLGVKAIICFNKVDLVKKEEVQALKQIYEKIGYPVIETNATEEKSVEKIKTFLKNHITAFAGNSGVGKSTLINTIFQKEMAQAGVISNKNQKGKNTTTAVTLYEYEKDTYLADTPGFSTFELSEISSNELDCYFKEFKQYLNHCEFSRL